ncbi:hypothetical protein Droror1_Dr00016111 [Drosera rotundifolia]
MSKKIIILSENKPEFEQLPPSPSPSSPRAAVTAAFVAARSRCHRRVGIALTVAFVVAGSRAVATAGSPEKRRLHQHLLDEMVIVDQAKSAPERVIDGDTVRLELRRQPAVDDAAPERVIDE